MFPILSLFTLMILPYLRRSFAESLVTNGKAECFSKLRNAQTSREKESYVPDYLVKAIPANLLDLCSKQGDTVHSERKQLTSHPSQPKTALRDSLVSMKGLSAFPRQVTPSHPSTLHASPLVSGTYSLLILSNAMN